MLVLALVAAFMLALGWGRIALSPLDIVQVLLQPTGLTQVPDEAASSVVWAVRIPRALLAALCGAGLACAGAALQGTLRNPLVGPQNVGVLSGAGFGGALALMFALPEFAVILVAFAAGLGAMLLVVLLGRSAEGPSVLMIILSGMIVSALFAALTTIVQYLADPERQLPSLVFWLMGSFSTASFSALGWVAAPILAGIAVLVVYAFRLNVLASGEDEARSLGINVRRDRLVVLVAVSAIAAAVVAVAGLVSWVGLVIPHFARMAVGPDHRRLLPASALMGGAYLLLVDTVCRSATTSEIPVGALTALMGAPVFIWLLKRTQGRGWRSA